MIEGITPHRGGFRLIYKGVDGVFHVIYQDTRIQAETFLKRRAKERREAEEALALVEAKAAEKAAKKAEKIAKAAEKANAKLLRTNKKHFDSEHQDLPVGVCQYRMNQLRKGKTVWYDCIRTAYKVDGSYKYFNRTFGVGRTRDEDIKEVLTFRDELKKKQHI